MDRIAFLPSGMEWACGMCHLKNDRDGWHCVGWLSNFLSEEFEEECGLNGKILWKKCYARLRKWKFSKEEEWMGLLLMCICVQLSVKLLKISIKMPTLSGKSLKNPNKWRISLKTSNGLSDELKSSLLAVKCDLTPSLPKVTNPSQKLVR